MEDVLKRIEYQFVGLSCVELCHIYQLRLRVKAFQCLTALDNSADINQLCPAFLAVLNRVNEYVIVSVFQCYYSITVNEVVFYPVFVCLFSVCLSVSKFFTLKLLSGSS